MKNSITLSESTGILEGQEIQVIEAEWKVVEEESGIDNCAGNMIIEIPGTSSYYRHGYSYRFGLDYPYRFDPQASLCRAWRNVPHYMPSGVYTVVHIDMRDNAGNETGVNFRHSGSSMENLSDEPAPEIRLTTETPDYEPPELDLNNISIVATPTRPEDPNGETFVTLKYRIRDNISGVTIADIRLRDPQGIEHFSYMDPKDGDIHGSTWFPSEDPSVWSDETWTVLLPAGSAPGIWGIAEIGIRDRANNFKRYDFTEIIHFVVD